MTQAAFTSRGTACNEILWISVGILSADASSCHYIVFVGMFIMLSHFFIFFILFYCYSYPPTDSIT